MAKPPPQNSVVTQSISSFLDTQAPHYYSQPPCHGGNCFLRNSRFTQQFPILFMCFGIPFYPNPCCFYKKRSQPFLSHRYQMPTRSLQTAMSNSRGQPKVTGDFFSAIKNVQDQIAQDKNVLAVTNPTPGDSSQRIIYIAMICSEQISWICVSTSFFSRRKKLSSRI